MSDNNNIHINTPEIGPYTRLQPFRFWCQKVLPLVYDESLSYYELLCKVVDYLNKTMEDVDQMIDDMGDFQSAYAEFTGEMRDAYIEMGRKFDQLKIFVETYFDNLNVQTEINNKLDAMAEDGYFDTLFTTLFTDDIITTAGNTTSAWIADNLLQETGYVIDNSLTVQNAAADAKAVGDEITDLKNAVSDLYDNKIVPTMTNGKYISYANGNEISDVDSACTNAIPVTPGTRLRLKNLYLTSDRSVCWYSTSGYGGQFAHGTSDTELVITIPAGAASIKATAKVNETVDITLIEAIDLRFDAIESDIELEKKKPAIKQLYFPWYKFTKPNDFTPTIPFNIYGDGHNFITDFVFDDFKNTGGTTYYTAPNALNSNDGLTRATPKKFSGIYSAAQDGDTIVLMEGDYDRNSMEWISTPIRKNINLIGEGKCRIFAGEIDLTFAQSVGYTNVYQTTRSYAYRVIDFTAIEDKYIAYELKSSIAEVEAKEGSYYIDGATVYVHALGHGNPTNKVCVTVSSEKWLDVDNNNQNTKVCMKHIDLIGKVSGVLFNRADTSNTLEVVCEDVNLYHCGHSNSDSFKLYGGTVIFNKCKATCSYKDGFNYNGTNEGGTPTDMLGIEIDCEGSNCGLLQASESQNGTTAHAGAKIIRVNGVYYNNFGANVADVQSNTMSLNLGCKAFYSAGSQGGANENFAAQQYGATMWLYGCVGVGAVKDLSCVSGATMNLDKCTYKIKGGAGTYNEQNTVPFDIYTLYKASEV